MAQKLPTKRYGTRYGRRTKTKVANIEVLQRAKHICPFCRKPAVRRLAVGIWNCRKCMKKFTGKAYLPK